ncbi:hypothetical protein ACFYV5_16260 [Streptomyces sp. NPDC003035]|uniref:hypothetical protein n=1 Tax=Streptomyces sp. NPDC003035 TaxID=3364676 RepID=UPI0036A2C112
MTDTTLAPVAGPDAPPDNTPTPTPEPAPAPAAAAVDHTPGGWPVVPLAVTGTNATASLLAAAALVGGPAALAVAATGAVVLGTAAAATRHRRDRKTNAKTGSGRTTRTGTTAGTGSTGRRSTGRVPTQARNGNAGTGKTAGRGRGTGSRTTGGSSPAGKKPARLSSTRESPANGLSSSGTSASPRRSAGRLGQVRALRDAARQTSPSRATRRKDTTGARRSVADARRQARAEQRAASLPRKGAVGRAVGKAAGRIGKARSAAIERARETRDGRASGQVAARRDQVRKAPARKQARKALRRSAARFQRRRLLAALLAGALGIVGLITSPIGRKLNLPWLVHPGRRLYARLMRTAAEQREGRDSITRAELLIKEAIADAEAAEENAEQIGDQVERPAGLVPAAPTTSNDSIEGETVSGFRFEEYAAEMQAAANSYDPENAMEILAMVEGLPAALTSVANVMKILAERSDSEFPLEKEVAGGFNDIFGALMAAVAVAEDMGPLFRTAHEQDIARHEDPRNGTQAEKGWNV